MGKRLALLTAAILAIAFATPAFAGYGASLRLASKTGRLYHVQMWDANLIWHATLFTDTFRDAFISRHIKVEYLNDDEARLFSEEQQRRQDAGWEFFISMYTKDRLKDFSTYPDSFWKICLITEGGEQVSPLSIDPLPSEPYLEVMFPYIDRWSRCYRVVFPKVPLSGKVTLVMQSVVGASEVSWHLK